MNSKSNVGRKRRGRLEIIETGSPYLPRYVLGDCYTSDHRPRRNLSAKLKKGSPAGRRKEVSRVFKPLPKRIRTALYYQLSPEEQEKLDMQ